MNSLKVRENPPISINSWEKLNMYRILFDDITSNDVEIKWADRHALGDLAVMIVERDRLVNELEEKGEGIKLENNIRGDVTKKNFARTAVEKLRPQIANMMKEFKMTPASRNIKLNNNNTPTGDGMDDV